MQEIMHSEPPKIGHQIIKHQFIVWCLDSLDQRIFTSSSGKSSLVIVSNFILKQQKSTDIFTESLGLTIQTLY